MVETFFKSIKAEMIWRNRWETRRQAEGATFQYINGFIIQDGDTLHWVEKAPWLLNEGLHK